MLGGDLGDTNLDLSTNAVDGLALPGSLSEVVVYLQISRDADDRCRASPKSRCPYRQRTLRHPRDSVEVRGLSTVGLKECFKC